MTQPLELPTGEPLEGGAFVGKEATEIRLTNQQSTLRVVYPRDVAEHLARALARALVTGVPTRAVENTPIGPRESINVAWMFTRTPIGGVEWRVTSGIITQCYRTPPGVAEAFVKEQTGKHLP